MEKMSVEDDESQMMNAKLLNGLRTLNSDQTMSGWVQGYKYTCTAVNGHCFMGNTYV